MATETLSLALTAIGMAAALIWLIIRLATGQATAERMNLPNEILLIALGVLIPGAMPL